jgi:hypothetical protein
MEQAVLWTWRRILGALAAAAMTILSLQVVKDHVEKPQAGKMPAVTPSPLPTPQTVPRGHADTRYQ